MFGAGKSSWRRWSIALLLGSAESAAADFSQAPLMVSYSSLLTNIAPSYMSPNSGRMGGGEGCVVLANKYSFGTSRDMEPK